MKFLANENYPFPSIKILRAHGYDVKSIAEDNFGITDIEVLNIAQSEDRIILTLDKDYGELIFRYKANNPPAVIFYRYKGVSPEFAGTTLINILNDQYISLSNVFTVIEQNNLRQRKYTNS